MLLAHGTKEKRQAFFVVVVKKYVTTGNRLWNNVLEVTIRQSGLGWGGLPFF